MRPASRLIVAVVLLACGMAITVAGITAGGGPALLAAVGGAMIMAGFIGVD